MRMSGVPLIERIHVWLVVNEKRSTLPADYCVGLHSCV